MSDLIPTRPIQESEVIAQLKQDFQDFLDQRDIQNENKLDVVKKNILFTLDSFVTASSFDINVGIKVVATRGFNTPGLGGATYVYDDNVNTTTVAANPRTQFLSKNGLGFRLSSDLINSHMFGAVGDGIADDTAALNHGTLFALKTKTTLRLLAGIYLVSDTVCAWTGLVGDNAGSFIQAKNKQSFPGNKPIVKIGWNRAEAASMNLPTLAQGFIVSDFFVKGCGIRTPLRSSDAATMNFDGDGVLFDESSHGITPERVQVTFCYRGFVFGNRTGHLGLSHCTSANNWYNVYWTTNTGDYLIDRCILTGALFSTLGASGDRINDGVHLGGIFGLFVKDTHFGFSPYVYYQPDGTSTVGLVGCVIDGRHEQVGNMVYRTGICTSGQRNNNGNTFKQVGHSWTNTTADLDSYNSYTILNDDNYPIQPYALDFQLIQGSPCQIIEGLGWFSGTSGYHTRIAGLYGSWYDVNGTAGYKIDAGILEFLTTDPYKKTLVVGSKQIGSDAGNTTLFGPFTVPDRVKGIVSSYISLNLPVDNTHTETVTLQLRMRVDNVTSGVVALIYVPVGASSITLPPMKVVPGAVMYVEIPSPFGGLGPVVFNGPIAGQITLEIANQGY